MSETYSGSQGTKRMTNSQLRRYLKKMKNSFKYADVMKEKLNEQKSRDEMSADHELTTNLDALLE